MYARSGFNGATLDQVAAEAGFTKGAVYAHFGSKENLLFALLEEHMRSQLEEQVELFDRERATWERPIAGSASWVASLEQEPDRFRLLIELWAYAQRDERLRERAGALLVQAFGGRVSASLPTWSDHPLARVHFIIAVTPGAHADPDLLALEAEVARIARTWADDFEAAIRDGASDASAAARLLGAYREAFPAGYRDRYDGVEALADLSEIDRLDGDGEVRVRAFRLCRGETTPAISGCLVATVTLRPVVLEI